jgi:hypothetical protein
VNCFCPLAPSTERETKRPRASRGETFGGSAVALHFRSNDRL